MDIDHPDGAPKEPSFNGQLRIRDFMFSPSPGTGAGSGLHTDSDTGPSASPRRQSPRLLAGSGRASLSPAKAQTLRSNTTTSSSSLSRGTTARASTSAINRKQALSRSASASSTLSRASRASPSPSSPSPSKKRTRVPSGYAPPSTYAHLSQLPDALAPNLLILFIGLNPGISTAQTGHAYAHRSNLFWKLLYSSGITPVPCTAEEDRSMPARYALGLTNIVSRPSRNGAELSKAEMDEGVAVLEAKCAKWRPEVVCIVGKSIWESIFRVRKGRALKKGEFSYGWQNGERRMGLNVPAAASAAAASPSTSSLSSYFHPPTSDIPSATTTPTQTVPDTDTDQQQHAQPWPGARIFVASSTSGLAATLKPAEKEAIWKELGDWCVERRAQRERQGARAGGKAQGSE
ncbi:uracil-DNA glycosylase-like protein [Microdochium trichocladiopsis]|uniref:Uracil-DNA glycosylase-like protein n=1 Tax=Microdochium trichocladiopsis TaxID=1682393 RepID=A0A9P9BNN8_9PEZI|nr:uracil-DNA glycosylase-like protein [Microdochium trichocladiopsis]KAH7027624.1 uracil-DNA glycosylase-like protein [Microdochium trichocladiopsis]